MRQLLFHPAWAYRRSSDCRKWMYQPDGSRMERACRPVMRLPVIPTPCHACPKIPAGVEKTSDNAVEPSARSWAAYEPYRECRAVGHFPDDPWVRRHAAAIRAIEDRRADQPQRLMLALLGGKIT